MQLINAAVQSVAGVAGLARPGIHHRLISMIVDGLRPRDDNIPMPVPPLTEDELSRAVRSSAHDAGER